MHCHNSFNLFQAIIPLFATVVGGVLVIIGQHILFDTQKKKEKIQLLRSYSASFILRAYAYRAWYENSLMMIKDESERQRMILTRREECIQNLYSMHMNLDPNKPDEKSILDKADALYGQSKATITDYKSASDKDAYITKTEGDLRKIDRDLKELLRK